MLAIAGPYLASTLERHHVEVLTERLFAEAREAGEVLPWEEGPSLDAIVARMAANLAARVTVIDAGGRVLGESTRPSRDIENHADRPEIREALSGGVGSAIRHSATAGVSLLYAAVRQERAGRMRIIRIAVPMGLIDANVAHLRWSLSAGLLGATLVGLLAALLSSRRLLRRVQRLVRYTSLVAADAPTPYFGAERADEIGQLEAQLPEMASRIAGTIAAVRVEQERLEAILRGMVESVVVTDLDDRVVLLNARARELFGVAGEGEQRGRPLIELVRDPAVAAILHELRTAHAAVSRDITLDVHTLHVNGALLSGPDERPMGAVLVLHDVTELRRLERVRRDFVANVSHELRTPLTAIKGYAETLLGAAGDDPATRQRFLAIIDRHSERLGRLIDDLSALSDLELGRIPMRLGAIAVGPAIDDVVQVFADRAQRAGITLTTNIAPDTPPLRADGDRLRQVLINLVDNAIKYTASGGHVTIRAGGSTPVPPGMVALAIEDSGVGIPAQDLPRLTERFFRVDKARSREVGGTGLGLAIVKHLVQAHGGVLQIHSTFGHGTTVTLLWPSAGATAA